MSESLSIATSTTLQKLISTATSTATSTAAASHGAAKYKVDFNYPVVIAILLLCLLTMLYYAFQRLERGKMLPKVLFRLLCVLTLCQLVYGYFLTEFPMFRDKKNPNARSHLIISFISTHMIARTLICVLRCFQYADIIKHSKAKLATLIFNICITILIAICAIQAIRMHYFREFEVDPVLKKNMFALMPSYLFAIMLLFALVSIPSTMLSIRMIAGSDIIREKGYFTYFRLAMLPKFAVFHVLEQIWHISYSGMLYTHTVSFTKGYIHSTTVTLVVSVVILYLSMFSDETRLFEEKKTTRNELSADNSKLMDENSEKK